MAEITRTIIDKKGQKVNVVNLLTPLEDDDIDVARLYQIHIGTNWGIITVKRITKCESELDTDRLNQAHIGKWDKKHTCGINGLSPALEEIFKKAEAMANYWIGCEPEEVRAEYEKLLQEDIWPNLAW